MGVDMMHLPSIFKNIIHKNIIPSAPNPFRRRLQAPHPMLFKGSHRLGPPMLTSNQDCKQRMACTTHKLSPFAALISYVPSLSPSFPTRSSPSDYRSLVSLGFQASGIFEHSLDS